MTRLSMSIIRKYFTELSTVTISLRGKEITALIELWVIEVAVISKKFVGLF